MVILLQNKINSFGLVDLKDWKTTVLTNLDDLQKIESAFAKIEGIPLNVSTDPSTDLDKYLDYSGIISIRHNVGDLVCYYSSLPILHGTHVAQFLKKTAEDKEKIIIGGRSRVVRNFLSPAYLTIDVSYLESTR